MPSNLPDMPQQLFITHDVYVLILALPIGDDCNFVMTDPNAPAIDPMPEEISPSTPSCSPCVNIHKRADCNLRERPPLRNA